MSSPVVFCADVHIGNHKRMGGEMRAGLNDRGRLSVAAFRCALGRAVALRASDFVVAGDLFDDDHPNPQLIAEVQRAIGEAADEGVATHLLVGNHDQTSDAPGHNALAPLAPLAAVIERPTVVRRKHIEIGLVPYQPRPAAEYIAEVARDLDWDVVRPAAARVLVVHAGVKDALTPAFLRDARDALDAQELAEIAASVGVGIVMTGNWHNRQRWTIDVEGAPVRVEQIGSLCPTGFDDLTPEHGIAIWRDGDVTFEDVPGPRFLKITGETGVDVAAAERAGHKLFVSVTAPADALATVARNLAASVERGQIAAGEVLPNDAAEGQARAAADAARSAGGLAAALAAYVEAMPLPEGVERVDVLDRAREYLR